MSVPDMPGVYPGTTRQDYEAIQAINYSTLKWFRKSPAHAKRQIDKPAAPTEEMVLGTAFHTAVLEPDRFDERYAVAPKVDRRTKDGKETWKTFQESNVGKTLINEFDYEVLLAMTRRLSSHPEAKAMLTAKGHNEVAVVWIDQDTGLLCKALMDRITTTNIGTVVLDLKTTTDASPKGFARDIAKHHYHAQAAWYLNGLYSLANASRTFVFAAIEKEAPYGCGVYRLDPDSLQQGRQLCRLWLDQYARCKETNNWPCYSDDLEVITLPRWAFTENNDEF